MACPLVRRYPRELRNNLGRYLGLFFMMAFAVSFTSGFLTAAGSIKTIIAGMDETYRMEDGHVTFDFEPAGEALRGASEIGIDFVRDFYKEVPLEIGSQGGITCRLYCLRQELNLAAYAEGHAPQGEAEVALDRVFCENHELAVGDVVTLAGIPFTLSGIMTYPDYQALFEDNTSFMFNALTFCVAEVSEGGYRSLRNAREVPNYAFTFPDETLDVKERSEREMEAIRVLGDSGTSIQTLVDARDNQGIGYALDDVEGDSVMWSVLLFLLVVIMGFVFVVLTSSTIEQEASVIGTLLASGYRKRELVVHYLLPPALTGVVSAATGLAVGLTLLVEPMKGLYYHSYSLPPYRPYLDWKTIFVCGVIPPLTLAAITFAGLMRALGFTPLQFLRHEVSASRSKTHVAFPERIGFSLRFRLRVLLRNASSFVTLFFGIAFASLLLLFGLCMLPVVDGYAQALRKTIPASHLYVLKVPLELVGTPEEVERYEAVLRLADESCWTEENRQARDALARLNDRPELARALRRLEDDPALADTLEVLKGADEELLAAAALLEGQEELLGAVGRLAGKDEVVEAARRLSLRPYYIEAARRLGERPEMAAAFARLEAQPHACAAWQLMRSRPVLLDLCWRMRSSALTKEDELVLSVADETTRTAISVVAGLDEQTISDLMLVENMDFGYEMALSTIGAADARTLRDIALVSGAGQSVLADIELVGASDPEVLAACEVVGSSDPAVRDALASLGGLDEEARADIGLLTSLDEATLHDIELVRQMDEGLAHDLELASRIEDGDHVVNTQRNDEEALEGVERFAQTTMEVERAFGGMAEEVTVYGIEDGSVFWSGMGVSAGHAVCGDGLTEKCKAKVGEVATLKDPRTKQTFKVRLKGSVPNEADTNVYLTLEDFNLLFGNDRDYFCGYASSHELALDTRYVAAHVTPDDMDELSGQMRESMGGIMGMMMAMSVPIYLILIFLLTKTIIDRSARSISYLKVFGYRSHEVDGLYVRPITFAVLFSLVASVPLIIAALTALLKVVFMSYAGNFPLKIPLDRLALVVVFGMACYAVVALVLLTRIGRIPLSLALKVQE